MDFYFLRVLIPALLVDILTTLRFLKKTQVTRTSQLASAFIGVPLYLISAFVWVFIYSGDPRFQGQGVLGHYVFLGFGILFSFLRLIVGIIFFIGLRRG